MGMLFRMFAPKPLKRARRLAHPVSLVTPRPVRRAKMAAVNAANPAGAAKRAAKRSVVRSARARSSSASEGQGCAIAFFVLCLLLIFVGIFVVPAALIGHLFGVTPTLGQVFGNRGDAWMDAHYPNVVLRFVLVNLALYGCLFLSLVLLARRSVSRGKAREPWMVRYECKDGTVVPGVDRYPTKEAAMAAASNVGRVIVSGQERPAQSYFAVTDPRRDPGVKARKRQQAVDSDRSHAYCSNCHRRIHAGQRVCECGNRLRADWEKLFHQQQGVPAEPPSAPMQRPNQTGTPTAEKINPSPSRSSAQQAEGQAALHGPQMQLATPETELQLPKRFTQDWIWRNVPKLNPDQIPSLIDELQNRGWTTDEIERRVTPFLP